MRVFVVIFIVMILFGNKHVLHVNAQECLPARLAIGDEASVTAGAANCIRI